MYGGRGRVLSYDGGYPAAGYGGYGSPAYGAGYARAGPRYYPSNQPDYRAAGYGGYAAPVVAQPRVGYGGYGAGYYGAGAVAPVAGGAAGCCPPAQTTCVIPPSGPVNNPAPSNSCHAFESNVPAQAAEGLVSRDVQYQTEWVMVPVQKPIVYETYQKVQEVPTQHMVSVENLPCAPQATGVGPQARAFSV
eukprot:NODE_985_length_1074_cov_110.817318_g941_i0.p1 GENE.NODE_985_length_1074_cov_110.817318_g941_i0~~NODE_985_length_1074_cov_110.817318_g941_i0.p1  ORF type:complete len:218 (-),score=62.63 NODE_985_length_1074_cov_110.817318_g941_i0:420-992(-)